MADSAFMIQYRQEFIAQFEQSQSWLRNVCTTEAVIKGNQAMFHAWLHNGDPMFDHNGAARQTVNVPSHRPPDPAVSWEDGAVDAYEIEGLIDAAWSPARVAWLLEKFNGFGYRLYHRIRSPYLWGATSVQQRGKYAADRRWDPAVMDPQIGGMALLAALVTREPEIRSQMGDGGEVVAARTPPHDEAPGAGGGRRV